MKKFLFILTLCGSSAFAVDSLKMPLTMTETSIGPINSKTKATLENIKKLFKGYKVEADKYYVDGDIAGEQFKIFQGEDAIIEINADTTGKTYIFSVIIRDAKIKTPQNVHLGSKLEELIALKAFKTCKRGKEDSENEVHCTLKGGSNTTYTFLTSAEEEEKTQPGEEIEVAIQPKGRYLTGISWHPPREMRED